MFIRALIGAASRGGGGNRLSREGLSHVNSRHSNLETKRSHRNNEIQPSSFNFLRELSGSESPQRREGDRSRSSVNSESGTYSDVMRDQFRAQREADRLSVSNNTRSSETSGSYHDALSNPRRESDHDARSETSSISSYNRSETESVFDHDARSEASSVSDYGDEVHNNEVHNANTQHESTNSDNTEQRVEGWLEDVYPKAGDYEKHLWDGQNRLRKNPEDAEENERKLKEFLERLLKTDPHSQQMNSLIIPMAAGSLENIEGKLAPNPRL